jgi:LysM repeat protein
MLRSRPKFFLLLAVLAAGIYGCSNTKPAVDAGEAMPGDSASQADSVGSIPEDLLANEESKDAPAATENAPAPESDDSAKAFTDLTEPGAADSLAVIENGDSRAAETTGMMDTYTVKAGDTLMKVAFHIYGDIDRWKDLQSWNEGALKSKTALRKGMKLKYEAPSVPFSPDQHEHAYEIKKGDTLANIADELYGRKNKYKKLQNYNSKLIRNPNRIFAGFTLYYDITAKEVAEADARRKERMASSGDGSSSPMSQSSVTAPPPSAITPLPTDLTAPADTDPLAVAPNTVPAPASTLTEPPAPPAESSSVVPAPLPIGP